MLRKHIVFHGRVQGVGFRFYAVQKARQLGLAGWVRNVYDGTVEMEVQGEVNRIDELVAFLQERRYVRIDYMDMQVIPVRDERDFKERW